MSLLTPRRFDGLHFNSYDLLKLLALLSMTLDHVGMIFYPENDLLRVIGRISMPIWFFLIGYSKSQSITLELILLAAIMQIAFPIFGKDPLHSNILISIIVARLLYRTAIIPSLESRKTWILWCWLALLSLLTLSYLPTGFSYDAAALLMPLTGYIIRNNWKTDHTAAVFILCLSVFFIYSLGATHSQTGYTLLLALLFTLTGFALWHFNVKNFSLIKEHYSLKVGAYLARNSLYYYCIHIIAFYLLKEYVLPHGSF